MRFSDPEKDEVEVRPRSSKRGWLIFLGIPLLLIGLVAAVWLYFSIAGDTELQKAFAAADRQDPNWRLEDIEATRAVIPDEQNSAWLILDVRKQLPNNWQDGEQSQLPPDQRPPTVYERLEDHPVEMRLRADQIEALTNLLENHESALMRARTLIDYPKGRYQVAWAKDGISTLLPHVQHARDIASLLGFDAMLRAEEDDPEGAWNPCLAALNASRSLGDEPILISQLVRIACRSVAVGKVERLMAQGRLSDETLARMQRVLEEEAEEPLLYYGMRGERALTHRIMTALESGDMPWQSFMGGGSPTQPAGPDDVLAYFSLKSSHAYLLNDFTECLELLQRPDPDIEALRAKGRTVRKDAPSVARALLPSFDRLAESCLRSQAELRCAAAAAAAERYRLRHGRWPVSLAALPPGLLREVPRDPFDKQPLRMTRFRQGIVIYSVGADGEDNGGKLQATKIGGVKEKTDIGFRMWDVDKRRQTARELLPQMPREAP